MAKQKRLNKNLVAFLTVMSAVVVVSVVGLVIRQSTQRDPEVLARNARELEKSGDYEKYERALKMFHQAFVASGEKDTSYLLELAGVALKMGEINTWLGTLQKVNARNPQDATPLVQILEGLWGIREVTKAIYASDEWRDTGAKLLKLAESTPLTDGQITLAAASRVWGLWRSGEAMGVVETPEDAAMKQKWGADATAAARVLYEKSPSDPRAVATYVELIRREVQEEFQNARSMRASTAELDRITRRYAPRAFEVIRKAAAEQPADVGMCELLMNVARQQAARLREDGKQAEAEAAAAEATAIADRAVEARPDSPELLILRGRIVADQLAAMMLRDEHPDTAEFRARIMADGRRAIELAPESYQAYSLIADVQVLPSDDELRARKDDEGARGARFLAALQTFEEARDRTLTLRSLRANLNSIPRQVMLYRGFMTALAARDASRGQDAAMREQLLGRAKVFLDDATARFAKYPLTPYMLGAYLVTTRDVVGAIKAYEEAHAAAKALPEIGEGGRGVPEGQFWLGEMRTNGLPTERLAALYQSTGEYGEALRYAQLAMVQYEGDVGVTPPVRLVTLAAELNTALNKASAAMELLDRYKNAYESDPEFASARAKALNKLGRKEEAAQVAAAAKGGADSVEMQLWSARQSLIDGEHPAAMETVRPLLSDPNVSDSDVFSALQIYAAAAQRSDQREDALATVRALQGAAGRDGLKRQLRAFEVLLDEADETVRDAKLLEIQSEDATPTQRLELAFNLYAARGDTEKALPLLEKLRQERPDDTQLQAFEFGIRVNLKQFDRAEALLPGLSQADGGRGFDRAGGATFRAQLATAREDYEAAITEYRQAIESLPTSAELLTALGQSYYVSGRFAEAIDVLERAVAANPRSISAHGLLVDALDSRGEQIGGAARDTLRRRADEVFEELARLAPKHAFVVQRRERAAELADPLSAIDRREKRRSEDPNDRANLGRLSELYRQAWRQLDAARDERGKPALRDRANAYFASVVYQFAEVEQIGLLQQAADFFTLSQQRNHGEEFLRDFASKAEPGPRVLAQVFLGRFLERMDDVSEAERAYQEAQVLVRSFEGQNPEHTMQVKARVGLQLIDFYQRIGRVGEVIEACNWFINLLGDSHPAVADVRLRLVDALVGARQLADARRELGVYVEKHGETVEGVAARARMHLVELKRDEAEADLGVILAKAPQNQWALLTRGWLRLLRARPDEAKVDLFAARELVAPSSPLAPRLYSLLSRYYQTIRQPDEAVRALESQLSAMRTGGASVVEIETIVLELVDVLKSVGRFDDAQKLISENMSLDPNAPKWPRLLADILRERGDISAAKRDQAAATSHYEAAASYYGRAAEAFGEKELVAYASAVGARMDALVLAGRAQEALKYFDEFPLSKLNVRPVNIPEPAWPREQSRVRLALLPPVARTFQALRDVPTAKKNWQMALVEGARGHQQLMRDAISEALKSLPPGDVGALLEQAVSENPVSTPVGQTLRIGLAEHLGKSAKQEGADTAGLRARALGLLDEVDKAAGTNAVIVANMLLERAQLLDDADDEKAAIEAYEQVLRIQDTNRIALNNLAYKLVTARDTSLRKPETAVALCERLEPLIDMRLDMGFGDASSAASMFDTIGSVYHEYAKAQQGDRTRQLERAAEALNQSVLLQPDKNAEAYAHLAAVLVDLGRTAEARDLVGRGLTAARSGGDEAGVQRLGELMRTLE